jgi:spore coat polysaccharide biosynthesis predicted glycosyltransferase SpsG
VTAPRPLVVLFRVAAGPQVGFGHLARSRVLARELGVPLHVSLRGSGKTAAVARRFGASVLPGGLHALARFKPQLVVVDDPDTDAGARWVVGARRRGVAVASIHDGLVRNADADLVVDGSILALRTRRALSRQRPAPPALRGPDYAVIDVAAAGPAGRRNAREQWRVLVALGGGAHVRQFAAPIARAIGRRCARARVVIAAGFSAGPRPALPANARWIDVPGGLGFEL